MTRLLSRDEARAFVETLVSVRNARPTPARAHGLTRPICAATRSCTTTRS